MNALVKLVPLALVSSVACAQMSQLEAGKKAIHARTGCFLVDYSFAETETLKPGYVRDTRVYEVNKDKSIKEWIIATDISPTRVKLQHVLQGTTLKGEHMPGGIIRHTGEDWAFNATRRFEYAGPNAKTEDTWNVIQLEPNEWLRRVTSLDDGLRYECSAAWTTDTEYASWACQDMAPISGREYRDMKRKDYQDLQRTSTLVVYDSNWLEREANTKIVDADGVKTPLVKEFGKTWYARLPDAECKDAQAFATPRRVAFWDITREAWDEELAGVSTWSDAKTMKGKDSRYGRIADMEETWIRKDLSQPAVRAEAKAAVKKVIEETQAGK